MENQKNKINKGLCWFFFSISPGEKYQFMWHHLMTQDAGEKKMYLARKLKNFEEVAVALDLQFILKTVSVSFVLFDIFSKPENYIYIYILFCKTLGHSFSYLYYYNFQSA